MIYRVHITQITCLFRLQLICNYCVSVQGLHPLEEHFKANYVTISREGCPSLKAPLNAPSLFLFWDDALLRSFVASHIPRFFARPKRNDMQSALITKKSINLNSHTSFDLLTLSTGEQLLSDWFMFCSDVKSLHTRNLLRIRK